MLHPLCPSLLEKPKHSMVKEVVVNPGEKGLDPRTKDRSPDLELMIILIPGGEITKKKVTEKMILTVDTEETEAVPDTAIEEVFPLKEEMETISVEIHLEEGVEATGGKNAMNLAVEEILTGVTIEILTEEEITLTREEAVMVKEEILEEMIPAEKSRKEALQER